MDKFKPMIMSTRLGPIAYHLEGDTGPLIAGFHGSPGSMEQILAVMDKMELAPPLCRRLVIDRAGYKRTPLDSCRKMTEQADLFAALLDELEIGFVDVILAFSGGGIMALDFAGRHPQRVKKLLLLAAITESHPSYEDSLREKLMFTVPGMNLSVAMSYIFPGLALKSLIAFMSTFNSAQLREEYRNVKSSAEDRDFLLKLLRLNYPFGHLRAGLMNETDEFFEVNNDYSTLKLPIFQIHGRYDADVDFSHAENLCRRVESASLLEVKDGYHLLMVGGRFKEIKEKIFDFCEVSTST